ncbi:MAG: hypothetical protein AB9888_04935 [Bacteroidales bacterium]
MSKLGIRWLPWVALLAIVGMAGLLWLGSGTRSQMMTESSETRLSVEAAVQPLLALHPTAADDPALQTALQNFSKAEYVSQVWFFAPDGKTTFLQGVPLKNVDAHLHMVTPVRQALAALPEGTLTAEQRLLVAASSALQAEGEHADVFRYRVYPVYAAAGQMVGVLGVAYDVSPHLGAAPNLAMMASTLGAGLCFCLYWLSLPLWTWLDARRRGERAAIWALFVLLGNLVALLAYLLVRRPVMESI